MRKLFPLFAFCILLTSAGWAEDRARFRKQPSQIDIDWPTYLHDSSRSAMAPEAIKLPLECQWIYHARHRPKPAWPPPAKRDIWHDLRQLPARAVFDRAFHVVSAGGRVYFGSSADDQVTCLDLKTGHPLWKFFTEGPVRLAPNVVGQRVVFGSDDGHAYSITAADGKLIWKYRASPGKRRIAGNGRIISAWPVRSDVLVINGQARFTAGLFPEQGTYQFALDATTGKFLAKGTLNFSPQGYLQQQGQKLLVARGRSGKQSFTKLNRRGSAQAAGKSLGKVPNGYPYALIGAGDMRFAGGEGKVAAFQAANLKVLWSAKVDGKAYSLAIASDRLLVSTDAGIIYCFAPSSGNKTPAQVIQTKSSPIKYPNKKLQQRYASYAKRILDQTQITKGYCLVLGSGDGWLVYELAKRTELNVIGLEPDAAKVAASRDMLDRAGLYGRAVIHHGSLNRLEYSDYLMNLVVSDSMIETGNLPGGAAEIMRVTRPDGGVAFLGMTDEVMRAKKFDEKTFGKWLGKASATWSISRDGGFWATYRRGPLRGAGQWTHLYANAAGTLNSSDQRVGSQLAVQWFGQPGPRKMIDRHHRSMSPLYKKGRMFIVGDEHLFAVDAYNGTPLWDLTVPNSRRIAVNRDCGNVAVADDVLYHVAGQQCFGYDPQSGKKVATFSVPQSADGKPRDWGYLATDGPLLLASGVKPGASRSKVGKQTIKESYQDHHPVVTSDFLFCLDRKSSKQLWRYDRNTGAIINTSIILGGSRMYFIQSTNAATLQAASGRSKLSALVGKGAQLVALDLQSGKVRWEKTIDLHEIHHDLYLCFVKERVLLVGSGNQGKGKQGKLWYYLRCWDAKNGNVLWRHDQRTPIKLNGFHGEQNRRPVIVGDHVYLEPYAFHLVTGKPIADWRAFKRAGCGTWAASASTLYFRDKHCAMFDLASRKKLKVSSISRPGCWINMIPAGGLLLIPEGSSGCKCDYALQSSMAFRPIESPTSSNQTRPKSSN